jgi:hypothetical protein
MLMKDEEMRVDTFSVSNVSPFTRDEVVDAMNISNLNKGLGPDCFDGNVLRNNSQLSEKVTAEITDALNNAIIPEYLRVGRLVTLQKT